MCRSQLPVWQAFYEKHRDENFELVAVAMDAAAPDKARELYAGAGATFVRAIDRSDALWDRLGFDVVPNGVFIDERGIVRYAKFGGFEARDPNDLQAIEALLAGSVPHAAAPTIAAKTQTASAADTSSSRYWFRLGVDALDAGDKAAAARYWRKALELDPNNFVIHKQIWALEHPEQFYPAINAEWQREQLAQEKKK